MGEEGTAGRCAGQAGASGALSTWHLSHSPCLELPRQHGKEPVVSQLHPRRQPCELASDLTSTSLSRLLCLMVIIIEPA